jgi:hypothetical protein
MGRTAAIRLFILRTLISNYSIPQISQRATHERVLARALFLPRCLTRSSNGVSTWGYGIFFAGPRTLLCGIVVLRGDLTVTSPTVGKVFVALTVASCRLQGRSYSVERLACVARGYRLPAPFDSY